MQAERLAVTPVPVRSDRPQAERPEEVKLIGVARSFARDQEIYGQGEDAELVYKVVSGVVREVRMLADGRRQIVDFRFPGDVFGVEPGAARQASAEAVGEATVIVARRSGVVAEQPQALWRLALSDLARSQNHALTLGRRTASERVVAFLLDLEERHDAGEAMIELPVSRQDMADYLGLTIETVSRTLTQLQHEGLIQLQGCRQVRLARRQTLCELCE